VTQSSTESSTQNYLTPVGSFTKSASYYGTFDQGGDVYQWNDALIGSLSRGVRGGQWGTGSNDLLSNDRESRNATGDNDGVGFRVASGPPTIPEKAGQYTLLLSATAPGPAIPHGVGYAILSVSSTGGAIFAGKLPDNESFTTSASLVSTASGIQCTLNVPLSYPSTTGSGALTGVLNFKMIPGSDIDGTLNWRKPPQTSGAYPAAINTNLSVLGSVYLLPPGGSALPGFKNGILELSDAGALAVSSSNELQESVVLTSSNTLTVTHPKDSLTVTLVPSTGVFRGTFLYPATNPVETDFGGVLFQDRTAGYGFFLGPDGSGQVSLAP
jgi:hypothetical protein